MKRFIILLIVFTVTLLAGTVLGGDTFYSGVSATLCGLVLSFAIDKFVFKHGK